tara:strand:- start:1358 stop:1921 length:564 start_codon:yes stop_codon:yes gene_type:complete
MERNINRKIDTHNQEYKEFIKGQFIELDSFVSEYLGSSSNAFEIIHTQILNRLQKCYDHKKMGLTKEDFQKRKRIKNVVSLCERCCACRANSEQCTRRKRDGSEFCGTHVKGTPHGVIKDNGDVPTVGKKTSVWAQDIKGIMYHIDDIGNVYKAEDVMKNTNNPGIIANYTTKDVGGETEYTLSNYH